MTGWKKASLRKRAADSRSYPRLRRYIGLVVAVCIGGGASAVLFGAVIAWKQAKTRTDFYLASRSRAALIKREIEANLLIVESLGAFLASSDELSRGDIQTLGREFHGFAPHLLSQHPNVQVLEWAPRVPDDQRDTYEAAAREAGYADFQITDRQTQGEMVPADRREEYFPVYFVEPREGNEHAIGFDLASNTARLEAMHRARDTGQTVTTGRMVLVQETGTQFGFLVFTPVYRKGALIETVEDRQRNLEGFGLGVFRVGDLIDNAIGFVAPVGINIRLVDMSADPDSQFLYAHTSRLVDGGDAPASSAVANSLVYRETFDVGGRQWGVICTPTAEFLAIRAAWEPWVVLLVGYLLTGIVVLYIASAVRHAAHIECLVEQLTLANRNLSDEVIEHKEAQKQLAQAKRRLEQADSMLEQGVQERRT